MQKWFSLSKVSLTDRADLHLRGMPYSSMYITFNDVVHLRYDMASG
jgi:hypothetical protein